MRRPPEWGLELANGAELIGMREAYHATRPRVRLLLLAALSNAARLGARLALVDSTADTGDRAR